MPSKPTREASGKPAEKPVRKKPAARAKAKKPTGADGPPEVAVRDSPAPSSLRGILPTTPEIDALVEKLLQGRPCTPAARQMIEDALKLQYYFGGQPLLYRQTDRGKEVLAVGREEVRRLYRRRMPVAQRESIILAHPDPWQPPAASDTH